MSDTTMQVPAHIAARIAARGGQKSSVLAAVLTEGFAYPKISTRASRFRLVEDGVETVVGTTLDVVIVGSNPKVSKIWYSKPYDGSDNVRPDCWSDDGVSPHPDVETPFHPTCATCPNNILGSKITPNGAKSKICGDQRNLAVVPAADPTKVYGLTVPVSGMKGLREYFKDLSNYGMIPEEVVTELGFDEKASYPKITFAQKKQNGFVPEKALAAIEEIAASEEVKIATRQVSGAPRLAAPKATALPPGTPSPAAVVPDITVAPAAVPKAEAAPAPAPEKPAKVAETKTTPAGNLSAMESKLASLFGDD